MDRCNWPVRYADDAPCDLLAGEEPEKVDNRLLYEEMAAEYLWRHTGRQFGLCEGVVRPCRRVSTAGVSTYGSAPPGYSPWRPALVGGEWLNLGCGGCPRGACGCDAGVTLDLGGPVAAVTAVTVGPDVLDPGAYRVDDYRLLVRQDGGEWPYRQDLGAPAGDPGTWSVSVQVGAAVPLGGQFAAGRLACELAKAAAGDKTCGLPTRWQSITRQGVSITALDNFEGLDEGKTGIWIIDSWVSSVTKATDAFAGFAIASPDLRAARRTTSGGGASSDPLYGGNF